MTEAEYIMLTYAEVKAHRTLSREDRWDDAVLDATAEILVARGFMSLVPTAPDQPVWHFDASGKAQSLIITDVGIAAYNTQDHDGRAMEETGALRARRPVAPR